MPIIRKVIPIGKTSRAVILPKSWLVYSENELGCKVEHVAIEVNRELRITPLVQKKENP